MASSIYPFSSPLAHIMCMCCGWHLVTLYSNPDILDEYLIQEVQRIQQDHCLLPASLIVACRWPCHVRYKKKTRSEVCSLVDQENVTFRSDGEGQIVSERTRPSGFNRKFFVMPTSQLLDKYDVLLLPRDGGVDPTRGFTYGKRSYADSCRGTNPARSLRKFFTTYYHARFIHDGIGDPLDLTKTHDYSSGSSFWEDGWLYRWNSFPPNTSVEKMLEVRKRLLSIEVGRSLAVSKNLCRVHNVYSLKRFLQAHASPPNICCLRIWNECARTPDADSN